MSEKVLFVDDDARLLASLQRQFRKMFELETAEGAEEGLKKIAEESAFAVVVADRQMPGMDGIQFLAEVRQRAPDTVRIMLTGNADLEGTIRVVNEGSIFRFLTKPCASEVLAKAIQDAQHQYRLVTSEKELLNKTLSGSIRLMTEILSMIEPDSFGRGQMLREFIGRVAARHPLPNTWEVHLAAMLAHIGYLSIPPETMVRFRAGYPLSDAEQEMVTRAPETAARLLANIPRLEAVSRIVRYQSKNFDGTGFPADGLLGENLPLGSRLLKVLFDLSELQSKGVGTLQALVELQSRQGHYDPVMLEAVCSITRGALGPDSGATASGVRPILVNDLASGMILRSDVETKDGFLILSSGHSINDMVLEKIRNFARLTGVREPINVELPRK